MSNRGLTLLEILVAAVVLALSLLPLLGINTSSNQMTLDSYFEFLAVQIAQEPIEVFRSVGYPECTNLPGFPIGKAVPVGTNNGVYPVEATMFDRLIVLDPAKLPLCTITVFVYPKTSTAAKGWMRKGRSAIQVQGLVPYVR